MAYNVSGSVLGSLLENVGYALDQLKGLYRVQIEHLRWMSYHSFTSRYWNDTLFQTIGDGIAMSGR